MSQLAYFQSISFQMLGHLYLDQTWHFNYDAEYKFLTLLLQLKLPACVISPIQIKLGYMQNNQVPVAARSKA
jgi:hypothetical protein